MRRPLPSSYGECVGQLTQGARYASARIQSGLLEYARMLVVGSKWDFLTLTYSELANPSDH